MTTSSAEYTEEYFYTPSLKGLVQQLAHLAFFGDGMSVVSGAKGSGKTALAHELSGHLDQAHDIVSVTLTSDLELAECIEKVSQSLGILKSHSLSVGEMLAELRHYVQELAQDKKLVVLIIDDAHHLDDQAIGALVSLLQGRTDANYGLHPILLSEPGLDRRIDSLQILDVPVYDFEIPNLSPSELATFLARDASSEASLNSSVVQKLWVSSQGLPGSALKLLQGQSDVNSNGSQKGRFSGIPIGHIAATLVLALVLFWSLVLRNSDMEEAATGSGAVGSEPSLTSQKTPSPKEQLLSSETQNENEVQDARVETEPELVISDNSQSVSNIGEVADVAGSEQLDNSSIPTSMTETVKADVDEDESPVVISSAPPNGSEGSVGAPVASDEIKLSEAEAFLMSQEPNAYTLQVIAASKKASLEAYISRQENRETLFMYRGKREGKSWFVVVQGVYSTRDLASEALKLLPKEQAKAGPWPRKLSSIQEEIETFRRN